MSAIAFDITEAFMLLFRIEVLEKLITFIKLSGVEEQLSNVAKYEYSSVLINKEMRKKACLSPTNWFI